ncbi:MAG: single-stranded DNA-binding protein [Planctomycetota bacterium]
MASFNKVLLMGNLTRDPELSYTTQGTAVCKFGLAVNNSYVTSTGERKEDPLFIDIVVWKKQAESCATFLKKGRPVFIEGRLQLDNWQTASGEKRSKIKVVANRVQFIGAKPKSGDEVSEGKESGEEKALPDPSAVDDQDVIEEDIPF